MPLLPSRFPTKLRPRVDFAPEAFRKLIGTHGLTLRWEMQAECPCSLPVTSYGGPYAISEPKAVGTPRPDCPTCKGSGYRFHSAQEIKAVVTSAAQNPDRFRQYGEMASGMISVSTLPEHRLNLGDRLTPLDSVQRYREQHVYEAGTAINRTRYPIKPRILDLSAGLVELGVLDLYVTDATGVAAPGGARVEGVDFTISDDGGIEWINAPSDGARWSVSYTANPRYLIKDLPHPFRDTIVKTKLPAPVFSSLPINAMCALEFLASGGF